MNWLHRHARHTLAGRLFWLYLAMSFLFVALLMLLFRSGFRSEVETIVEPHLQQYLDYLVADIGEPANIEHAQTLATKLHIQIKITSNYLNWSSSSSISQPSINAKILRHYQVKGRNYFIGHTHEQSFAKVQTENSIYEFLIPHQQFSQKKNGFAPFLILLGILFFFYHATRRLFKPIDTIKYGIKQIEQGVLSHRIDVKRKDELGELAQHINTMADELERLLDAKRELLLAVSHELRTPLTRIKVILEIENDPKQLDMIRTELLDMEKLITDILESERLKNHSALTRTETNLSQLLKQIIGEDFRQHNIKLTLPISPCISQLDKMRITLAIRNIIDNAIKYSQQQAPEVTLECNDIIRIEVINYGNVIEASHLPLITEPFYRVDPSRQRQTGGYGLGLYLCKLIIEQHQGKLTITSSTDAGTRVSIVLP
ncbi:MAG: HAMP domain-containing histidine kinase [Gammaproteobacteria bacterium]|nr:HAMP domain-containing histidine kinase [Gammaproteobacteria bacterium]MDH5728465.1 HAMP domain-containing histidine kinase [Gammaproteobacteria bacterium]